MALNNPKIIICDLAGRIEIAYRDVNHAETIGKEIISKFERLIRLLEDANSPHVEWYLDNCRDTLSLLEACIKGCRNLTQHHQLLITLYFLGGLSEELDRDVNSSVNDAVWDIQKYANEVIYVEKHSV